MSQTTRFTYVKLGGLKLSPERLSGKEPSIKEVYGYIRKGDVAIDLQSMVAVRFVDGVHWLSERTYKYAEKVLGTSAYEAHEGVSFDVARGVWLVVGEPKPIEPPIGAPKGEKYVLVETELSRSLGLSPFIVEKKFIFKCFKGEDVGIGKVTRYRYFLAAYDKNANPLTIEKLEQTLLWRNYLNNPKVVEILGGVSEFMKKEMWHLERMNKYAVAQFKVVWKDVAAEFVPAVEVSRAVPDHNVHYVVIDSIEEAYYLLAVLLAPQINAVVRELSPWVGHVQPRFIKYFKIPKFNPRNEIHVKLSQLGRIIHERGGVMEEERKHIEDLVGKL
jgi:hypothetical protein